MNRPDETELAFMWQFDSHDAAMAWLESGAIEMGLTGYVYADGAVVMVARDIATAKLMLNVAAPLGALTDQ